MPAPVALLLMQGDPCVGSVFTDTRHYGGGLNSVLLDCVISLRGKNHADDNYIAPVKTQLIYFYYTATPNSFQCENSESTPKLRRKMCESIFKRILWLL